MIPVKIISLGAGVLALGLHLSPAFAQTALPPIPDSKVKQTKEHFEGNFTPMNRRKLEGGEIQEAWDHTKEFEGIFSYKKCEACTYKVRLRDQMVSVIQLPDGEKITAVDVGDLDNFPYKLRNANTIAVQPIGFGGDTSLILYGEEGRIYPFYLRAEAVNSKNIPDLVVKIHGQIAKEAPVPKWKEEKDTDNLDAGLSKEEAIADLTAHAYEKTEDSDYIEHVPFDPSKLRGWGEYDLWGDRELRPDTVFRDDHFTYIKYSKDKWAELELPTGYVVVDEIDELVNTHVKGTTFVIENTGRLITLKSGGKYLCIEYEGD